MILRCMMEKADNVIKEAAFHSSTDVILKSTNLNEIYYTWVSKILETIDTFQNQGSGWTFNSITDLEIHMVKYEPLNGSSYIPLPEKLAKKKAITNIKNEDNECFKWAITRAINMVEKNAERIDKKLIMKSNELNWDGISFPTALKEIDKFERNNPSISVNVAGYDKEVYPLRISNYERENNVDLLLISDGEKQHYCVIKNLSRLLTSQTYNKKVVRYYCRRCYASFTSQERLNLHKDICQSNESVKIKMPKEGTTQSFKHYFKSQSVPFVVYADFECFTKPIHTCQPNPNDSYTKQYQKHEPSGFCYYIKCFDDSVYSQEPVIYTKQSEEEDVAQIFVDTLENNIKDIYNKFKFPKPMIFGKQDEKLYNESTHCHICDLPLTPKDETNYTVRDHCHFIWVFFRGNCSQFMQSKL